MPKTSAQKNKATRTKKKLLGMKEFRMWADPEEIKRLEEMRGAIVLQRRLDGSIKYKGEG